MNLDEYLTVELDLTFKRIRVITTKKQIEVGDDALRCLIISGSLSGLAHVFLEADDRGLSMDYKQAALGLLATSAWLKGDLDVDLG